MIKKPHNGGVLYTDEDALRYLDIDGQPTDRYFFDFTVCTNENGWEQFDTDQDA